jgi:hypothetical protein
MPPEFSLRSDSVDVEQIMKQIRSRIREKRGVDYTDEEIRELAGLKLERFLDPAKLRSDLLEQYRSRRPVPPATAIELPPAPANYAFEADTPYQSSRGAAGWLLFKLRRLLNPLLKLFINPTPIVHVINMQGTINAQTTARIDRLAEHLNTQWLHRENMRRDMDALNYEVAHNLVLEVTRLSMDVKNMKMRVESVSSRLEFAERRARALEAVVQYKAGAGPAAETAKPAAQGAIAPPAPAPAGAGTGGGDAAGPAKGEAQRRRRRRRRGRGTGGGGQAGLPESAPGGAADNGGPDEDPGDDLFSGATDADAGDRATDAPADAPAPAGHDRAEQPPVPAPDRPEPDQTS